MLKITLHNNLNNLINMKYVLLLYKVVKAGYTMLFSLPLLVFSGFRKAAVKVDLWPMAKEQLFHFRALLSTLIVGILQNLEISLGVTD